MTSTSRLLDLIELAKEPSSERRRALLREVTDLFLSPSTLPTEQGMDLFDGVMSQLASEMEAQVRLELAERLSDAPRGPSRLMSKLAHDEIDIAEPVLRRSKALTEADLLSVVRTKGEGHLQAVSLREEVSEAVSGVIVERGGDETVRLLVRNEGARMSRATHEAVVDRAKDNAELHEAVVHRRCLPVDLLNEMYFVVENRLREDILGRNAQLPPEELEAALSAGRSRIASLDGALPADYPAAEAAVKALRARGDLNPARLVSFLREGERTKFLIALCALADVDFPTARRVVEKRELDALAIICKAAGFDRALFLTFAVSILQKEANPMGRAQEYGRLYQDLPRDTALRTVRFWRMRRAGGDAQAA